MCLLSMCISLCGEREEKERDRNRKKGETVNIDKTEVNCDCTFHLFNLL